MINLLRKSKKPEIVNPKITTINIKNTVKNKAEPTTCTFNAFGDGTNVIFVTLFSSVIKLYVENAFNAMYSKYRACLIQ